MGYKQDVLGVQVGATIWMCYKQDVLGLKVGATKKIGYEKDVLGKIGGQGHYVPHVAPVPGFSLPFDNVPNLPTKPATSANVGGSAQIKKALATSLLPAARVDPLSMDLNALSGLE